MKRYFWGLMALIVLVAGAGRAKAGVVYTLDDTKNGVSATAAFQVVSGGIEITVTNTEANTPDAGHAISQIQFTVGGKLLGLPTAFTELSGLETDFVSAPTFKDYLAPGAAQNWQFGTAGASTVNLLNVGGYGGQPDHLIVAAGSTPNASLTNTHLPSFVGPVHFVLADSQVPADLTLADVTGVKFAFGTKPEVPLEAATGSYVPPTPVPAPGGLALLGVAAVCLGVYAHRRREPG